jgi:LacI family transcriptional regulator
MTLRNKRITTKELAQDLGVSRATIDRALHGRGRISHETRARIEQRARELGYRPNLVARSLALTRPVQIMALFPSHPASFFDKLHEGIRGAADAYADHPFSVEVRHTDQHDLEQQRAIVRGLDGATCDGLIIVPAHGDALNGEIDRLVDNGTHVICVNTDAPKSNRTTFIGQDFVRAGRLVAELLVKLTGDRARVLALGGFPDVYAHTERLRGFREELAQRYPLVTVERGPDCFDDPDRAYRAVRDFFAAGAATGTDAQAAARAGATTNTGAGAGAGANTGVGIEPRTGVFAATGAGTHGVARALKEQRESGGEKAYFVGFDFFPEIQQFLMDEIVDAVVEQNAFRQGFDAVELMHRHFIERRRVHPETIHTKLDIILRNNIPRER